jgi:hypothetical protein
VHWTRGALVDFPGPATAEAKYGDSGLLKEKKKRSIIKAKHGEIVKEREKGKREKKRKTKINKRLTLRSSQDLLYCFDSHRCRLGNLLLCHYRRRREKHNRWVSSEQGIVNMCK